MADTDRSANQYIGPTLISVFVLLLTLSNPSPGLYFYKNGTRPQLFYKGKTTSIFTNGRLLKTIKCNLKQLKYKNCCGIALGNLLYKNFNETIFPQLYKSFGWKSVVDSKVVLGFAKL